MELTTPIDLKLNEKFQNKTYFHKFFISRAKDKVAQQIRELRGLRKLTQTQLAHFSGMKQSAVSRIEQAEYAGWNFKTLARIAEALDARLMVTFQTREETIQELEREQQYETQGSWVLKGFRESRLYPRQVQRPELVQQIREQKHEINFYQPKPSGLVVQSNEAAWPRSDRGLSW